MTKNVVRVAWLLMFFLAIGLSACTPLASASGPAPATQTVAPAPAAASYTTPFAYCAAVGTIDHPDGGYTGETVPVAVIDGFKQAAGLQDSTEPLDLLKQTTIWRCMDGQVYACNVGANLPCDAKANTDQTPTQAMNDFCAANSNSEFIPMAVTGHETVYNWRCNGAVAEVVDQFAQVDSRGYVADIWYKIESGK